jgi:hypothetical protein
MKAQPQELRIGNYLLDDEDDTLVVVSKIETPEYTDWNSGDEFNIVVLKYGTKEHYLEGDFRKILLTEEWLLKLGFVWSIQHQAFYLKGFDYVLDVCKDYCRVIKHRRTGEVLINVQYVHQLQNLYFALTNQELTFKLD